MTTPTKKELRALVVKRWVGDMMTGGGDESPFATQIERAYKEAIQKAVFKLADDQPQAAPTREVLRQFYEKVRAHFGNEVAITVRIKFEEDRDYRTTDVWIWQPEDAKYGHLIILGGQSFYAATLDLAFEKAKAEYKPVNPLAKDAAEKLRKLADAVQAGYAPIPDNL